MRREYSPNEERLSSSHDRNHLVSEELDNTTVLSKSIYLEEPQ